MTDFCITAVKYAASGDHIELVRVREELPGKLGERYDVPRSFVASLIRKGKATFQTRVWSKSDEIWLSGADIHVIEDTYLTTDRNSTKRDNLGELPTF